ncbi:SOS response-associated peptidase family protein [Bradyrhizobium japonicum]|uniref:SOS response-associated peptidase family protein n=1 Tax=Bradyrhizobium japonicum TaxID=375 RepID=UPI003513B340
MEWCCSATSRRHGPCRFWRFCPARRHDRSIKGYAFLTTDANTEVFAVHPKAMPVILTTPEEVETWMTAPAEEALKLQRPLPDGALEIVARGTKEDKVD